MRRAVALVVVTATLSFGAAPFRAVPVAAQQDSAKLDGYKKEAV